MGNVMVVRKFADRTGGERIVRFDPVTGEKKLVNPATPGDAHEPWPLAGVQLIDPPDECVVSSRWVADAAREGWVTREGTRIVTRPAGPANVPDVENHLFVHADALVFHTVDGDVRYRVVRQPDKYAADEQGRPLADDEPVTPDMYAAGQTLVDWTFHLEREGDNG